MTYFPHTGTAPIDLGTCLICGKSLTLGDVSLRVEMNVHDGEFAAHQNHPELDHGGAHIDAERVSGVTHLGCYRKWYEETYHSPFTMNA